MSAFYVTTPIYYVNDRPHIGTAYSTIAADVLARYHRMRGQPTRFLTGVDEHGIKLERRAKELGQSPQAYVDSMVPPFKDAWKLLSCEYDDFIRTTEPRHKERVQALWRMCRERGDIYDADYQGLYCVGCEAYYTEKELLEGRLCPIHKTQVEVLNERTYFFRLSAYQDKLLAFFEQHPTFVQPESRYNEVKSFVREGLRDVSLSRSTFKWGIEVPDAPDHVIYVWFDALTNYISSLGGPKLADEAPDPDGLFETFWPPHSQTVHIVGKDILRFHAVYWPAFLMSAGLPPPTQVWAHGWLTVDGQKMSKSLGNFIHPAPIVEAVGADVLRYYLMRDIAFGQDGDFSHQSLFARYHGELGNGLGNLLNRILASIVRKTLEGKVPVIDRDQLLPIDRALLDVAQATARSAARQLDEVRPNRALEAIWELVSAANKYVDQTEPWKLVKQGNSARLGQVVYTSLEALRYLGLMLWPFMPSKASELLTQLGFDALAPEQRVDLWPDDWGKLPGGIETRPGKPLFPRFEKEQEAALLEKLIPKVAPAAAPVSSDAAAPAAAIAPAGKPSAPRDLGEKAATHIDVFGQIDLRVGEVKLAERVPKSDKLLRLEVDLGALGTRQILAGIGKHYAPEALVGKRIAVLANLPPRKMMGLMSQGMVLAAGDGDVLSVLSPQNDVPLGSTIA
ncbi:MAG: methionyl-tRNA synthetase [Myxococcaceae bacterium]|nr:methionyl-tRNA synthetase [Myxococcaceae bacterium]